MWKRCHALWQESPLHEPVYKTVVKKEPKIEVTKMSADQAGIQVDVNNGGAEVRGVSKIYVYKGSKKIKTFTSAATSKYTFTYKAKGKFGSAKYKAKVEMIEKTKNDAKTRRQCLQRQIHIPWRSAPSWATMKKMKIKFVTQSLFLQWKYHYCKGIYCKYDGSRSRLSVLYLCFLSANWIYQYRSPANKVIKKGIHKYTFKVKNVSVVDLRHCGINVK